MKDILMVKVRIHIRVEVKLTEKQITALGCTISSLIRLLLT